MQVRRCDIIRGGMETYLTPMGPNKLSVNPIFEIGPLEPRFSEWLVFEGVSVDETGATSLLSHTLARLFMSQRDGGPKTAHSAGTSV